MVLSKKPITIYLADLVHNYFPGTYTIPLNIANIAVYAKENLGNNLNIELFKFPNDLLDALKKNRPDILGLSNYFWNNDLNFQIGTYVKQCYPDTIIAMGGPSIRIDHSGIKNFLKMNNFVDIYMMLEGEAPFLNFLELLINKGNKNIFKDGLDIEGCAYLLNKDLIYSALTTQLDLYKLPSCYVSGALDKFLKLDLIPLFESNRGCPFTCTFCTWGVASKKMLRKFPLNRVFDDMEYVAKANPGSSYWIFADSNFGILERDLEIAKKIAEIKKRAPALKMIEIWASKNTTERNLTIAKYINESKRQVISFQTLDPLVEKCIKRENVDLAGALKTVKAFKQSGVEVLTDILCGLPGETKDSHLATLKKCFDIGFDSIDVGNVYLLPGSEMETDISRKNFNITGKYRLRQGSYGVYDTIKSIECEEVIRATSSIGEEEMPTFRLLHWLIWLGWNSNFLKPLMLYLQSQYGVHPLDFITEIIRRDKSKFLNVKDLFNRFLSEAGREWFDTPAELKEFYMQPERLNNLLKYGSSKINFKYIAEFILNRSLYKEFCDFIANIIPDSASVPSLGDNDIIPFIREIIINADEIFESGVLPKKTLRIKKEYAPYILNNSQIPKEFDNSYLNVILYKDNEDIKLLRKMLIKYSFDKNKIFAVEKTLENSITAFSYKICVEKSYAKSYYKA